MLSEGDSVVSEKAPLIPKGFLIISKSHLPLTEAEPKVLKKRQKKDNFMDPASLDQKQLPEEPPKTQKEPKKKKFKKKKKKPEEEEKPSSSDSDRENMAELQFRRPEKKKRKRKRKRKD